MTALQKPLGLPIVNSEIGPRLRDRRLRMGISVRQLADEADVDRGRLAKLEAGDANARMTTIGKVEAALGRLEQEMGMDDPVPPVDLAQIEIVVDGKGVRVTVKGPVVDRKAMEESAVDIWRSTQESSPRAAD